MQDHDHDQNPCVGLGGAPHDHAASCTGSCSAHSPPGTLVCPGTAAGSIAAAQGRVAQHQHLLQALTRHVLPFPHSSLELILEKSVKQLMFRPWLLGFCTFRAKGAESHFNGKLSRSVKLQKFICAQVIFF